MERIEKKERKGEETDCCRKLLPFLYFFRREDYLGSSLRLASKKNIPAVTFKSTMNVMIFCHTDSGKFANAAISTTSKQLR